MSEPTLAVPQNVAKKIAPRKKKKKAVTPGYGIGQDPSKSDVYVPISYFVLKVI